MWKRSLNNWFIHSVELVESKVVGNKRNGLMSNSDIYTRSFYAPEDTLVRSGHIKICASTHVAAQYEQHELFCKTVINVTHEHYSYSN